MPFYDFKCKICDENQPTYRKIADRDDMQAHCGTPMQRQISAPALRLEISEYVSPASGKLISSRSQRREDLLREGCIANEPGLKEQIARNAEAQRERAFAPLSNLIDQTVSNLHASGHIAGD